MTQEQRATQAGYILESTVFRDVWDRIDARILRQWRGSRDADERSRLWLKQQVLSEVRMELVGEIEEMAKNGPGDGPFMQMLNRIKGWF